jgi:hypothetical protein
VKFDPLPHQGAMLDWLRTHDRALLWCGCGLGKTAVTLAALEERLIDGARGALIVSPLRVSRITWPEQAALWDHSSWLKVVNLNTPEGEQAWEDGSAHVYLTHYDVLESKTIARKGGAKHYPGHVERFLKRKNIPADILVIDETTVLKNPSSKRGNTLRKFAHHFPVRWGLTGTPVPNSYLDVFAQVRLIDDGERLGRAFHQFRGSHFSSDYMGFKWELRPGAKERIDAKVSDLALVMLSEDWLVVPPVTIHDVVVSLPDAAKRAYLKLEKHLLLELERADITAASAATLANKLLQFTGGAAYDDDGSARPLHDAKVSALARLRKSLGSAPLLVLVSYIHEMDRVLAAIPGARRFDERHLPEFKAGKIHTWVADFRSLSHGIDGLQVACNNACWFTPTWSRESYDQTNARLVRQGQTSPTTIHRLIAPGTIDDAVVEALRTKGDTQTGLLKAVRNLQRLKQ